MMHAWSAWFNFTAKRYEEREELRETLLEDRGPAYIPWLVKEFEAQAGLFMSQLLFWDGKGHDPDGWIYKSEKEWRHETGLTRSAVRNARKILTKRGVLEEQKRGLPRRLYYRADLRALMEIGDLLRPVHAQEVHCLEQLEHPPQRRPVGRLAPLMPDACSRFHQSLP